MLSKEAIEKLEQIIAANAALPKTQIPIVALPSGVGLNSLEKYLDYPVRHRAKFDTDSLTSFFDYLQPRAGKSSAGVFIDKANMKAVCHLHIGDQDTPLWDDDTASVRIYKTPEYAGLLGLEQQNLTQRQFAEFIEDWDGVINFDSNNPALDVYEARQRIMRLDMNARAVVSNKEGDLSRQRSALEAIEITSGAATPPTEFAFKCKPFADLQERIIKARISYITGEKAPTIKYRLIGAEMMAESIAQEFCDVIRATLGDDMPVLIGNYVGQAG